MDSMLGKTYGSNLSQARKNQELEIRLNQLESQLQNYSTGQRNLKDTANNTNDKESLRDHSNLRTSSSLLIEGLNTQTLERRVQEHVLPVHVVEDELEKRRGSTKSQERSNPLSTIRQVNNGLAFGSSQIQPESGTNGLHRSNSSPRTNIQKAKEIRHFVNNVVSTSQEFLRSRSQRETEASALKRSDRKKPEEVYNPAIAKCRSNPAFKSCERSHDQETSGGRNSNQGQSRNIVQIAASEHKLFHDITGSRINVDSLSNTKELDKLTGTQDLSQIHSRYVKQCSNMYTLYSEKDLREEELNRESAPSGAHEQDPIPFSMVSSFNNAHNTQDKKQFETQIDDKDKLLYKNREDSQAKPILVNVNTPYDELTSELRTTRQEFVDMKNENDRLRDQIERMQQVMDRLNEDKRLALSLHELKMQQFDNRVKLMELKMKSNEKGKHKPSSSI